jgi:hypothetical protein
MERLLFWSAMELGAPPVDAGQPQVPTAGTQVAGNQGATWRTRRGARPTAGRLGRSRWGGWSRRVRGEEHEAAQSSMAAADMQGSRAGL